MMPMEPIFANRYDLKQRIGVGAFAEVWRAIDTYTKTEVAIKIFSPDKGIDDSGIELFRKEYVTAFELNHPHLLRTFHFDVTHKGSPYLVMPYCKEGSLMRKLASEYVFSERDLALIMMQMADALMYLNGKNFYHRDVKPDNILVYSEDHYVLSDFGISTGIRRTLERTVGQDNHKFFSGSFTAPEYFEGGATHPKSDIFSLGVTLYELALASLPYPEMAQAVKHNYVLPDLPQPRFTLALSQIIKRCLHLNPDSRPDASSLYAWAQFYLNNGYWDIFSIEPQKAQLSNTTPNPNPEPPANGYQQPYVQQNPTPVFPPPFDPTLPEQEPAPSAKLPYILAGATLVVLLALGGYLLAGKLLPTAPTPIPIPAYNQLADLNPAAATALQQYLNDNAKAALPDADGKTDTPLQDLRLLPNATANGSYSDFAVLTFGISPRLLCLLRHPDKPQQAQLLLLSLPPNNTKGKTTADMVKPCPNCTGIELLPPKTKIKFPAPDGSLTTYTPNDTVALINAPEEKRLLYNTNGKIGFHQWKTNQVK